MSKLRLHVLFCSRAPPTLNASFLSVLCKSCSPSPDFTITLFYRPPCSNVCVLDRLFSTLCNLDVSAFSNFYLIGDFNVNFVCEASPFYSNLLSIVSSFNLTQVVTEPTRISSNTATLIDLIFVSRPPLVESCITNSPTCKL